VKVAAKSLCQLAKISDFVAVVATTSNTKERQRLSQGHVLNAVKSFSQ